DDCAVNDPGGDERRRLRRKVVASRAVDEHADRVVVVDPRMVDRQRAYGLRRRVLRRRARDHRDTDSVVVAAEAAWHLIAVLALVGDEAGHARAIDRPLRVDEDDAGGCIDPGAVEGNAGDVDGDRRVDLADGREEIALAVTEVRLRLGDAARLGLAPRYDRDLVGSRALQAEVALDRQRV